MSLLIDLVSLSDVVDISLFVELFIILIVLIDDAFRDNILALTPHDVVNVLDIVLLFDVLGKNSLIFTFAPDNNKFLFVH